MPEEPASAPEQGTPTETAETPQGTPAESQEINWAEEGPRFKQRYEDLRPHADRSQQQLDEFQQRLQDPDQARELLSEYGYQFADDNEEVEDDDEFVDPYEQRISQIEQMLGERQTAEQQEQMEEAEVEFINEGLEQIQKDTGEELSEQAAQMIGDLSQVNRDEQGRPDVRGAYEAVFKEFLPEVKKSWTDSKKAPRAAQGKAAVENPSLDTERDRVDYMAQRMAELEDT